MPDMEFKLHGLQGLLSKLDAIKVETGIKSGWQALRRAAITMQQEAISRALQQDDPKTKEQIAKNVVIRRFGKRFLKQGQIGVRVGILGGAKQYAGNKSNRQKGRVGKSYKTGGSKDNPGGDTFYWRFLEFGTKNMAARPFMRPSMTANIETATKVFGVEMEKAIDRAIKRGNA